MLSYEISFITSGSGIKDTGQTGLVSGQIMSTLKA